MRTGMRRRAISLGTAVLIPMVVLAGCSGSSNDDASYNHQGSADTAATASTAGASTSATTTTSAGEVAASPQIANWNDDNIVAKLAMSDRGEVQLGKLAESKATSPAVKSFAKMLVTDHGKGEGEVHSLERKAKLPARTPPDDSTAKENADLMRKFSSMSKGAAWDSAFVQHEIEDHQHDIADAKAMQNQAKDAQLKQLIGKELPQLQKHLDAAQQTMGQIGGSAAATSGDSAKRSY